MAVPEATSLQQAAALVQQANVQHEFRSGFQASDPNQVVPILEHTSGLEGQLPSAAGVQLVLQSTTVLPVQV